MKVFCEETNTGSTSRWKSKKTTVLPNETCTTKFICIFICLTQLQIPLLNFIRKTEGNKMKKEKLYVFLDTLLIWIQYVSALFLHERDID